MKLFRFLRERKTLDNSSQPDESMVDLLNSTGKDFEFLIRGDIEISSEDFDEVMTPNTYEWRKIERDGWLYFQVCNDEFSYSFEPPGIQMSFNQEITYVKAKAIADEVVLNIEGKGFKPELVVLSSKRVYKFD